MLTSTSPTSPIAAGEAQGSGKGGRKSAGSWLQAIAKAMGEVLGQKAGEMVKLSDKISSLAQEGKGLEGDAKADNAADMTAAQTELQGVYWLQRRAGVALIRVRIEGAENSRIFAKAGTAMWPQIRLIF